MEDWLADIDQNIAGWMGESPRQEWLVLLPDGSELCRHATQAAAQAACERVRPLLEPEHRAGLRIQSLTRWPSYVNSADDDCAQFRFCRWAMRRLGHVTVFAFTETGQNDSAFMVLTRSGMRTDGPTLPAALLKLLRPGGEFLGQ
jgi:hypothetical protein